MSATLGSLVRGRREYRNLTQKECAKRARVSCQYWNDIEHDRRTPTEAVIASMSAILETDEIELMALAGRIGAKAEAYIAKRPSALRLLCLMATFDVDAGAIATMTSSVLKADGWNLNSEPSE